MNDHEGYYHICTDGLSRKLLFRDRNDYIYGMNDIPACLQLIEGEIICFSLMPNHVHFIVHTSAENAKRFIENYKKRLSGRLMRKYNEPHSLSRLGTLIKDIDSEDYLKTAIAYVLRNPLAANMVCLPNTYRWGSGYLYFRQSEITLCTNRTQRLGELTRRKMWEYTGVRSELPENYTIDNEGVILPENYINPKIAERIFGSPKQFLYYLSKNDDGEFEISQGIISKISYSYGQLREILYKTSLNEYRTKNFDDLDIARKLKIAILMKKRYGISYKQFARLTGIDPNILHEVMV